MVYQQRGHEHEGKSKAKHQVNHVLTYGISNVPNDAADRLPEGEQGNQ
jgi:hypothetical protein